MKLLHIYWVSLALSAIFYTMFMFAPWAYGTLEPEMQRLMSWGGYGSLIEIPAWVFWVQLIITLIGYAGMALFRKMFRLIFLGIIAVNLILAPLFGASVITGIEVFIIEASTLLSGVAIALSFYTKINDEFY